MCDAATLFEWLCALFAWQWVIKAPPSFLQGPCSRLSSWQPPPFNPLHAPSCPSPGLLLLSLWQSPDLEVVMCHLQDYTVRSCPTQGDSFLRWTTGTCLGVPLLACGLFQRLISLALEESTPVPQLSPNLFQGKAWALSLLYPSRCPAHSGCLRRVSGLWQWVQTCTYTSTHTHSCFGNHWLVWGAAVAQKTSLPLTPSWGLPGPGTDKLGVSSQKAFLAWVTSRHCKTSLSLSFHNCEVGMWSSSYFSRRWEVLGTDTDMRAEDS